MAITRNLQAEKPPVNHAEIDEQIPYEQERLLESFLQVSSRLQCLLADVRDYNVLNRKKIVIWTHFPVKQLLIVKLLQLISRNVKSIHSDLDAKTWAKISKECNLLDEGTVEILVMNYYVRTDGTNLHKTCSIVLLFDLHIADSTADVGGMRPQF